MSVNRTCRSIEMMNGRLHIATRTQLRAVALMPQSEPWFCHRGLDNMHKGGTAMEPNLVKISKFLSLVLRHKPDEIGLTLDENGWADVEDLLARANRAGVPLTRPLLKQVVETNDKKRFAFNADESRLRASQGHSVAVDLGLTPQPPPEVLYHGTATRFIGSIRKDGLLSGSRQHVHLSLDEPTAIKVGKRHGKPVVLVIQSGAMHRDGLQFFLSANNVWLTEKVAVKYIEFPAQPT
jgi:putative RNA 2'-phosphotransferase